MKNIKRYFFIQTNPEKIQGMSGIRHRYIVWYANYITIRIFGKFRTFIIGYNHFVTSDIKSAEDFLSTQKMLYKLALVNKNRR